MYNTKESCCEIFQQKTFVKLTDFFQNLCFQWYNLTLTQQFWANRPCQWESKIAKICLFGQPNGQATSWEANFENYFWNSVNSYQYKTASAILLFVSSTFLLSARFSQSHATSCLSLYLTIGLTINAIE